MSIRRLWSFILGRTNDVSGRCAQRQAEVEERLERSVQHLKSSAEYDERVGRWMCDTLALPTNHRKGNGCNQ